MTRTNINRDAEVLRYAARHGCHLVRNGNRPAFINPGDNACIYDLDGFVIVDSQQYLDEETKRINKKASRDDLNKVNNEIAELEGAINSLRRNVLQTYGDGENSQAEAEKFLASFDDYKEYMANLNKCFNKRRAIQRLINSILLGTYSARNKIDYKGIYRRCHVDEEACKLIVDNCGKDKLFSVGLGASWFNNLDEVDPRVELLKPFLGDQPIVFMPYSASSNSDVDDPPTEKIRTLVEMFGMFDLYLSLYGDDNRVAISAAKAAYAKKYGLETVLLSDYDPATAFHAMSEGMNKIMQKKAK